MTIIIRVYKVCLNFIYLFFKLIPTKKKITIISRQSNSKSIDITLLETALKKQLPDYKITVLCKKIEKPLLKKIGYFFYIFKLMHHITCSKVVILDSYCIPISLLKHKKSLYVIQMWHAMGLLKKAGYSILDTKEGSKKSFAKAMNMHKNYDAVFASSKACINGITKVFACDKKQIVISLLPRVDLLKDKNYLKETQKKIAAVYDFKNKKNIVYVPTFRKDETLMQKKVDELVAQIDYTRYNLIVKLHPNSKIVLTDERVICDHKFSSMEMLTVADYVISDYSSIIYEAGILRKKLYFYAFDFDDYEIGRGLFIDYLKEMPGLITKDAQELIKEIEANNYDFKKERLFINKYLDLSKNNVTLGIVDLIKKHL